MSMTPDLEKQQPMDSPPPDDGVSAESGPTRPNQVDSEPNLPSAPGPSSPASSPGGGFSPTMHPQNTGPSSRPFRKATFGIKKTEPTYDPVAATYDYTIKYKRDPLYHELGENARVWHVYNDEANAFDADMIEEAADSLDILLIFAGLFSAVLTTFVVQTSQSLMPDNAAISVSLLKELVALQRAQSQGMPLSSVPPGEEASAPSAIDKWFNGLWFISLALSLSSALCAVLAKQWLRQYRSLTTGSARDRALFRQLRYKSFMQWHVLSIIGFLPTILHVSLVLFLIGLVVFLTELDSAIAIVIGCITGVLLMFYLTTNFLPIFLLHCPYRTPLTFLVSRILPSRYKDVKAREIWSAQLWKLYGTGIPEALQWLVDTSANTSAQGVAAESVTALGLPSLAMNIPSIDVAKCQEAFCGLADAFYICFGLNAVNFPADGNLTNLMEEEKDGIQRGLMGCIFLQSTGVATDWLDEITSQTLCDAYRVSASDIGIGLMTLATTGGSGESVTLSIMSNDKSETYPIAVIESKDALAWAIDNYEAFHVPDLPAVVWDELWKLGDWKMSEIEARADISEEGKARIKEALKPETAWWNFLVTQGCMSLSEFLLLRRVLG